MVMQQVQEVLWLGRPWKCAGLPEEVVWEYGKPKQESRSDRREACRVLKTSSRFRVQAWDSRSTTALQLEAASVQADEVICSL